MIHIFNTQQKENIRYMLHNLGASPEGIKRMLPKSTHHCIRIDSISHQAAAILKQDMLSIGGDVAVHTDVMRYKKGSHPCMIMGTEKQIYLLLKKLQHQPYRLSFISSEIEHALKCYTKKTWTLNIRGKKKTIKHPLIMGILNVTPDSFFDGGKHKNIDTALNHAEKLIKEGADIIDVGGESSRPFSKRITKEEEINRVIPVIRAIRKRFKTIISIDTYKSVVAEQAFEKGADIVNDISALRFDKKMAQIIAKHKACVVLMHMAGTPATMQKNPKYKDIISDITQFFEKQIKVAKAAGIKNDSIIIDPGIGFGKTTKHNLEILKSIRMFSSIGYPLLVGHSRKSFIGKLALDATDFRSKHFYANSNTTKSHTREIFKFPKKNIPHSTPEERLPGTLAVIAHLVRERIPLLRVHDVAEAKQAISVMEAILEC